MSVSYIKPILTHEKLFAVGKSGPNATSDLVFLGGWVGLVLGSSTIFILIFCVFPNPT